MTNLNFREAEQNDETMMHVSVNVQKERRKERPRERENKSHKMRDNEETDNK